MSRTGPGGVAIDVFGEDSAHARIVECVVERVGKEVGFDVELRVRASAGGQPRAISEFEAYQRALAQGMLSTPTPDLIVVAIDGNCTSAAHVRSHIREKTKSEWRHMVVAACPDPHVERWIVADPDAFHKVVGARPAAAANKCDRGYYKRIVRQAISAAGYPGTLGGLEFVPDIVATMDFFRAQKNDASIKAFIGDLREKLRALGHGRQWILRESPARQPPSPAPTSPAPATPRS